jgi:hypothetical protein
MKITIFFLIALFACTAFAQSSPQVDPKAYRAALESEISASPRSRFLYEHADAYARLVKLRALKELGFDLTKSSSELPTIQQVEDSGTTLDITKNVSDQDETSLVINKKNENILIVGLNDDRMFSNGEYVYTSSNQGKSWSARTFPLPPAPFRVASGDPALAADDSGYFYYAYLATTENFGDADNLIVATSKDGKIWKNGSFIVPIADTGGFEDKEQITIDNNPASPYYGRLYIVWMHFGDASGQDITGSGMRIASSDDRGKTWNKIVSLGDEGLMEFCEVKTGKHGEVIVTYSIPDFGSGAGDHALYVSTDGGKQFTRSVFASYNDFPPNTWNRPSLKGDFGFRCFPYITHDIDLKTNQIHLVYGSFDEDSFGIPASVLYYITSTNLGSSWTAPKPLGISNPEHSSLSLDRFCPWVSVNQKTGDAYVVYYSSENDPDNLLVSLYRTKLTGGMAEYPRPIGDRDFDPTVINGGISPDFPAFIGDYIGSDAYDSVYAAAWTENRTDVSVVGDVFVYVATPKSTTSPVVGVNQPVVIRSNKLWLSAPQPNPIRNGLLTFSYYLPNSGPLNIELFSIAGIKARTLSVGKSEDGTFTKECSIDGLPSGEYLLRLVTDYGTAEKKVVIVK